MNATDLDFEGATPLQYSIIDGNEDGVFIINPTTGLITVNNTNLSDYYKLKVKNVCLIFIF